MNEQMFQEVLDNRAEMSNKGQRVNTKRAVKMLRDSLDRLAEKGFDQDAMMNLMLKHSWRGIKEDWLQGKLSPRHLTTTRAVSDAIQPFVASTRITKVHLRAKTRSR